MIKIGFTILLKWSFSDQSYELLSQADILIKILNLKNKNKKKNNKQTKASVSIPFDHT